MHLPRANRYKVTLFVATGSDMTLLGSTRDLSTSGLFLATKARPELNSLLDIALVWGDDTHTCAARVVRHSQDGIGLAFVEPDGAFMNALQDILLSESNLAARSED